MVWQPFVDGPSELFARNPSKNTRFLSSSKRPSAGAGFLQELWVTRDNMQGKGAGSRAAEGR